MHPIQKTIRENCRRLAEGGRTMEDIYNIIFSHSDNVMTEDASLAGRHKYRTYGQIQADIEAASRGIFALTGKTGQYIGLYAENKPQWITLFWAILKSGNLPYLINLRQPADFSADALKTLGAEVTLCLQEAPDLGTKRISYDTLMKSAPSHIPPVPFGDGFALSTSGTTLSRKICCYNGKSVAQQILNAGSITKENPLLIKPYRGKIKHLVFLPLYHIFGLEAVLLWYSFWGSTFVFPSDLSPEKLLRTVRDHDVTHIFAVPLLWSAVERSVRREAAKRPKATKKLKNALSVSLCLQKISPLLGKTVAARLFRGVRTRLFGETVQFCISGGSYIKSDTLSLINGLGYPLCNGYGMSEIGITSVDLSPRADQRIAATIGRPFDSVEYRLKDGHLLVKGASLCHKMIIDGVETALPEWFDTGDIMSRDARGRYTVDGRASDIVFGEDGENLNPDLAEQAFSLTAAKGFSVLGNDTNEKLMLVVHIPGDISPEQRKNLMEEIAAANATLPLSYKIAEIHFTFDPILAPNDIKVSRPRLRNAIKNGTVRLWDTPEDAPKHSNAQDSQLKTVLRKMFAEILGIPQSSVTDEGHFMNDLGGSSLDYFTLIGKIDDRFGVMLEFETENFSYCLNDFERILKERVG